jgi:hypothetical protein
VAAQLASRRSASWAVEPAGAVRAVRAVRVRPGSAVSRIVSKLLQGAGEGVEDAVRGAGQVAAFELGVVLHADAGADAVRVLEQKAQTLFKQADAHRELSSTLAHD